jgi:hypothetical protein
MNSGLQKRLYEMEVMPPPAVWEKLSLYIDEINADHAVSKKILDAELAPPAAIWEKINSTINLIEKKQPEKKAVIIYLRRLAAAAVFIGLVATAWILFSTKKASTDLTGTNDTPVQKESSADTNTNEKKKDKPGLIDLSGSKESIAATSDRPNSTPKQINNSFKKKRARLIARSNSVQYASLNAPLGKTFDQPIDDLSRVTADQHYLTMVNSNGRLVKIPAELAHLAPHLQDKPISEDIYEVMFGEGTYWKETMSEWRKKVASLPVSSGDAFTSFIELLKTVQNK